MEALLQESLETDFSDLTRGALWRVQVRHCDGTSLLCLTAHHVLVDGRGLANLLEHLISDNIPTEVAVEDLAVPPPMEHVHDTKPTLRYMLPILFKELLLPRLPSYIAAYFQSTPSWGTSPLDDAENHSQIQRRLLFFDEEGFVKDMKRHAVQQGIKTLQPLIHTAAVIAVWHLSTLEKGNHGVRGKGAAERQSKIVVQSGTPRSIREAARDSTCSGNAIAGVSGRYNAERA